MKRVFCFGVIVPAILFFNLAQSQNIAFKKGNFKDQKQEFKTAYNDLYAGNVLNNQEKFAEALTYYLKAQEFNPKK